MMYVMCLYQALPHAKIPLVPANGNSSLETTAVSPGASAVADFWPILNKLMISTYVLFLDKPHKQQ